MKSIFAALLALSVVACSSTKTASPDELAKAYMDALINDDAGSMQKVARANSQAAKSWDQRATNIKQLKAEGTIAYELRRCADRTSGTGRYCDYAITTPKGVAFTLAVHVTPADDGMKVDSALFGMR